MKQQGHNMLKSNLYRIGMISVLVLFVLTTFVSNQPGKAQHADSVQATPTPTPIHSLVWEVDRIIGCDPSQSGPTANYKAKGVSYGYTHTQVVYNINQGNSGTAVVYDLYAPINVPSHRLAFDVDQTIFLATQAVVSVEYWDAVANQRIAVYTPIYYVTKKACTYMALIQNNPATYNPSSTATPTLVSMPYPPPQR